jgi:hypothetical protein
MLSGGRILARENHRAEGVYLVPLLGDQRWEHVHVLLDQMLREDFPKRSLLQLLQVSLPNTADLVTNNFMPLRPSMGLRCQWCGRGRYQLVEQLRGGSWIGPGLRGLKCDVCGRLELFQTNAPRPDWLSQ